MTVLADSLAELVLASLCLASGTWPLPLQEDMDEWEADQFGTSLCNLGDVNGDGVPDCAVGAPSESTGGTVRVFSGKDGAVLYKLSGDVLGGQFGAFVAPCEDLDEDGILELAVGAPHWPPSPGSVAVFSGSDGKPIWKVEGAAGTETWFGQAVACAGDVDGDGLADIVVGATDGRRYGCDPGHARVLSGRDGSALVTLRIYGEPYELGTVVAGIGDVDGDDRSDVAVGGHSSPVEVFSGARGDHLYSAPANAAGICPVWDLNEDGVSDWVVGYGPGVVSSTPSGTQGSVSFVSGRDGKVMKTEKVSGFFSICVLGDLDSDDFPDYALGTDDFPGGGSTRVYSGRTGKVLHHFKGKVDYRHLGYSVSPAEIRFLSGGAYLLVYRATEKENRDPPRAPRGAGSRRSPRRGVAGLA